MEVYLLDSLFRQVEVVDEFLSMIWTERYSEVGDFELTTLTTQTNLSLFYVGRLIQITESKRVMKIETIESTVDSDGRQITKIKGRDLLSLLEARVAMKVVSGSVLPVWIMTGMTPGDTARYMFNQICVLGSVSALDEIPYIHTGSSLYPVDTIPEPSDLIEWDQKPASLLAAVKELADVYDLGIRLYKDPATTTLYFDVYAGSDRTSAQSTLTPVIFAPDLENLQNTTEYTAINTAYNVVRVIYPYHDTVTDTDVTASVIVTADDADPSVSGFDRRVKLLVISSIPEGTADIPAYLTQAGKDELAKSRPLGAFDGQVSLNGDLRYDRDYYLGDLVELRSSTGAANYMRIEEQIFAKDAQGERSYPTLTTKRFIEAGTWAAPEYDVDWSAMADTEFWFNQ